MKLFCEVSFSCKFSQGDCILSHGATTFNLALTFYSQAKSINNFISCSNLKVTQHVICISALIPHTAHFPAIADRLYFTNF